jgi:DNA processing protein
MSAELAAWVRLEQTPGVGAETARALLQVFGLPENIFGADFAALQSVVPKRIATALIAPLSTDIAAQIERTLSWSQQPGNHVLTLADAAYPRALLDIADPPLLLYAKGRLELLSRPSLAIVGSRNATTQGASNAEKFADTLSRAGWTIVSGMALGIDTAAHHGSLACLQEADAGDVRSTKSTLGSTIAVIGTGADIVYPARNRALAHRIAEQGCIISEYALGMPALSANFPRRNRIISGLSRGVLVIEAAAQSGSLITARMAADQGRDVFAIPGSIHSPLAKGCHLLIKQGAKLVESAQDVLEELGHDAIAQHVAQVAPAAAAPDSVLAAMGFDPVDVDSLAQRTGIDAAALSAQLLTLEMETQIEMLPGGLYQRVG